MLAHEPYTINQRYPLSKNHPIKELSIRLAVGYIVCPAETMTETLEDWAFVVWDKDIINYTGCYGLTGAGYNGMPVNLFVLLMHCLSRSQENLSL